VVRVVDVGLGGRSDPEILEQAAREGRVVVSRDRATLSAEAARRIEGGKPMPGLILLRRGVGVGRILEDLELLLATARSGELENAILYLPL
jgi:predicted nuclease of predicted toxin-antitoxin system